VGSNPTLSASLQNNCDQRLFSSAWPIFEGEGEERIYVDLMRILTGRRFFIIITI